MDRILDFNKNRFLSVIPKWILKLVIPIPVWMTDYQAALQEASQKKKIVFALFTGSDWCGHCVYLHVEVLTSGLFYLWANQRVVLLKIENLKYSKLPPELEKQNQMLQAKYNAYSYPTAIGLNADGTERGRTTGYSMGMGPKAYLIKFESDAKMNSLPFP